MSYNVDVRSHPPPRRAHPVLRCASGTALHGGAGPAGPVARSPMPRSCADSARRRNGMRHGVLRPASVHTVGRPDENVLTDTECVVAHRVGRPHHWPPDTAHRHSHTPHKKRTHRILTGTLTSSALHKDMAAACVPLIDHHIPCSSSERAASGQVRNHAAHAQKRDASHVLQSTHIWPSSLGPCFDPRTSARSVKSQAPA